MSANTIRKAKKLVESGGVQQIDEDLFQIKSSSDPNKSYTVTDMRCQCKGFRNYSARYPGTAPTCSHIEAIKIFKKLNSR